MPLYLKQGLVSLGKAGGVKLNGAISSRGFWKGEGIKPLCLWDLERSTGGERKQ